MLLEPTPLIWHNGKLVQREQAAVSIASHSLHLGIGVFDGIRAYWNGDRYYIHRLEAHLNRLRHGATQMGLEFSGTNADLTSGIESLLDAIPHTNYYIRPIVYRGGAYLNFSETMPVDVSILAVAIARDLDQPLKTQISRFERVSGRAIPVAWKICGTYVNSYLSRGAAQQDGFDDAILLDREGRITEATAANLFLLQKDKVITPALTPNIFPGITRETLLDIAKDLEIEVTERDIYPAKKSILSAAKKYTENRVALENRAYQLKR